MLALRGGTGENPHHPLLLRLSIPHQTSGKLSPAEERTAAGDNRRRAVSGFAAPFIIMRNTMRARRLVSRRFEFVMLSTILAGCRSLKSGAVVMMALHAAGFFA